MSNIFFISLIHLLLCTERSLVVIGTKTKSTECADGKCNCCVDSVCHPCDSVSPGVINDMEMIHRELEEFATEEEKHPPQPPGDSLTSGAYSSVAEVGKKSTTVTTCMNGMCRCCTDGVCKVCHPETPKIIKEQIGKHKSHSTKKEPVASEKLVGQNHPCNYTYECKRRRDKCINGVCKPCDDGTIHLVGKTCAVDAHCPNSTWKCLSEERSCVKQGKHQGEDRHDAY